MKNRRWILFVLAVLLLLTACSVQEPVLPMAGGVSGHASCDIGLATDGQQVYLLRTEKTLRPHSFTYAVYEVTGGGGKRITGGRDADDIAVAEGRLLIASHTLNWIKAVRDSAEIDAYDTATGKAEECQPGSVFLPSCGRKGHPPAGDVQLCGRSPA